MSLREGVVGASPVVVQSRSREEQYRSERGLIWMAWCEGYALMLSPKPFSLTFCTSSYLPIGASNFLFLGGITLNPPRRIRYEHPLDGCNVACGNRLEILHNPWVASQLGQKPYISGTLI